MAFRILLLVFILPTLCLGQKSRYTFAESYIGFEGEFIRETNNYSFFGKGNSLQSNKLPSTFTPRILIGATHFWGHADFYISIPLHNFKLNSSDAKISNGVFTAFRYLPIKLKAKTISPFFGLGFNSKEYLQESAIGSSGLYNNWQWFPEIGVSYKPKSNTILELGLRYFSKNSYNVYLNRQAYKNLEVSPISFQVAYKKLFDFTKSYDRPKVQQYMQKKILELEEKKAISTLSFGVGINALIPLEKNELASKQASFNDYIEGSISPDIGVAYYFHKLRSELRCSYRALKQEEEIYNYLFKTINHSFAFEAYTFFANYHGFVPFIGVFASSNNFNHIEKDKGVTISNYKQTKVGYGITFGWDIQQSKADYLVLRTNLRYMPALQHQINGSTFSQNQLEFNFIQLVFYPERYKIYKNN